MTRGWVATAAIGVLLLTGCQSDAGSATEVVDTPEVVSEPEAQRIRYEVIAEGGIAAGDRVAPAAFVTVTEVTPSGTAQNKDAAPYTSNHEFPSGSPVVVTAQAGTDVTSVSCAIYHGASKLAENTSTGSFAVVSCSALVP